MVDRRTEPRLFEYICFYARCIQQQRRSSSWTACVGAAKTHCQIFPPPTVPEGLSAMDAAAEHPSLLTVHPNLQSPVLSKEDQEIVGQMAHQHSVAAGSAIIATSVIFVLLEAAAAQEKPGDILELENVASNALSCHGGYPFNSLLCAAKKLWINRRASSANAIQPCGRPSTIVDRDRYAAGPDVDFLPFSPRHEPHPLGLPQLPPDNSAIHLFQRLRDVLGCPTFFPAPIQCIQHLFTPSPSLAPLRGLCPAEFSLFDLTELLCSLGAPLFGCAITRQRRPLSKKHTTITLACLRDHWPSVLDTVQGRGAEELYLARTMFDHEQRTAALSLFVVHTNGSVTSLCTIPDLSRRGRSAGPEKRDTFSVPPSELQLHDVQQFVAQCRCTCKTQGVFPLTRREGAFFHHILQRHPYVQYLTGCGVRSLLVAGNGMLVVERICGRSQMWDYHDSFGRNEAGRVVLLPPRRIVAGSKPLPRPGTIGRTDLELQEVIAMLEYYWNELLRQPLGEGSRGRIELFPENLAVMMFILRHHPQYYTSIRGCGIESVYIGGKRTALGTTPSYVARRVCGVSVEFDVSDCYFNNALRPPMVLSDSIPRKRPPSPQQYVS